MLRVNALRPVTALSRSYYVETIKGSKGIGGIHARNDLKVCVFGASTGNLGRNVVNELAQRGAICNIPCRGDIDEALRLKPLGDVGKVNGIPYHPKDEQSIADAIGNCDIVVNCVGKYYQTKFLLPCWVNYTYQDVNVFWPERLAKVCKEMGVKNLIHIGALQSNPKHNSEWARAKYMGEKVLREEFPDSIIVRPADMFGMEDRFLNWIAIIARKYPYLLTINGGQALKQPVAYHDVAKVILKLCNEPEAYYGQTVNLAGPKIYQYSELVQMCLDTIHFHPRLFDTPITVAKMIAGMMECGPLPYMSRSEVDLHITDNILTKDDKGLTFKDFDITPMTVEQEIFRILNKYRRGGHWAYEPDRV